MSHDKVVQKFHCSSFASAIVIHITFCEFVYLVQKFVSGRTSISQSWLVEFPEQFYSIRLETINVLSTNGPTATPPINVV